jgi:neuropeptide S receptor 1
MTVLAILFAVIVVGNCAVMAAILLSKSRKKRMNFFIMQLAIAGQYTNIIQLR